MSKDCERDKEKENGADLQDAFASISSATISSAKVHPLEVLLLLIARLHG
jgi:hypothetical protein